MFALPVGFSEASDVIAVSKFLEQIDVDRTGYITETEFIAFFQGVTRYHTLPSFAATHPDPPPLGCPPPQLKRADIQKRLRGLKSTGVSLRVVEYSSFRQQFSVTELAPQQIQQWMQNVCTKEWRHNDSTKKWIDVWGYDPAVMQIISSKYNLPSGNGDH